MTPDHRLLGGSNTGVNPRLQSRQFNSSPTGNWGKEFAPEEFRTNCALPRGVEQPALFTLHHLLRLIIMAAAARFLLGRQGRTFFPSATQIACENPVAPPQHFLYFFPEPQGIDYISDSLFETRDISREKTQRESRKANHTGKGSSSCRRC
jgi:hypothetical protein